MARRRERPKLNRWHLTEIADRVWFAEDGVHSLQVAHCHCLACAYCEVIGDYGGDCDLRGLHRYRNCYGLLAVIVRQQRDQARAEAKAKRQEAVQ